MGNAIPLGGHRIVNRSNRSTWAGIACGLGAMAVLVATFAFHTTENLGGRFGLVAFFLVNAGLLFRLSRCDVVVTADGTVQIRNLLGSRTVPVGVVEAVVVRNAFVRIGDWAPQIVRVVRRDGLPITCRGLSDHSAAVALRSAYSVERAIALAGPAGAAVGTAARIPDINTALDYYVQMLGHRSGRPNPAELDLFLQQREALSRRP